MADPETGDPADTPARFRAIGSEGGTRGGPEERSAFSYGDEDAWRAGRRPLRHRRSTSPLPGDPEPGDPQPLVLYSHGDEDAWSGRTRRDRVKGLAWGPYGRRPLALLAMVAGIDSVDRGILPGVLTRAQDDLGFGDTAAGVLGTAFVITGFLVMLPSGYLADRYRRTRIIAIVLASWGVISALNAGVRNYGQFLAVRASLGVGETIDNPASQSLLADYYPPTRRGRAYALQRIAPTLGTAIGTGLGGLVGATLGWRWAFLLVGVPGSLLAIAVWRLPEPRRGGIDDEARSPDGDAPSEPPATRPGGDGPGPPGDGRGEPRSRAAETTEVSVDTDPPRRTLGGDLREVLRVRTLRALMLGTAISQGATVGLGFWAPAFYERHTSLGSGGAAGVTAGLILMGALTGTFLGGTVTDRTRARAAGAPMVVAGTAQFTGGALLMITFAPVPLWFRMPVQILGVAFLVAGFPALTTMIAEVVPATIRGISFSLTSFLGALAGAISPLLIGFIADQYSFMVDGELKGHLANAFLTVSPLVLIGALVVLGGRRHVRADLHRAAAARAAMLAAAN